MAPDRDEPEPEPGPEAPGARPDRVEDVAPLDDEDVTHIDDDVDGLEDLFDPDALGDEPDNGLHTGLPPKMEAWRKRSATGAILTGFALGLQQAFEKEREQPAIIMTTSGDPPRDLPVEADFEHGRPRQSVVSIRPWLLGEPAEEPTAGGAPTGAQTGESGDTEAAGGDAGRDSAGSTDA